ncbi:TadE-like protein [Lachnotalea glycerini]|nr:TadE family protein [Lachnotalea glycerini]PXV91821.1 TadE-like protein [Lachnotalea glycerini]
MELKGSFTVEAALVMPLVLGAIIILIYMSFFLHDRAVICEGAIILANRYTNENNITNEAIKQQLVKASNELINKKVIITSDLSTIITVTNNKILVSCSGSFMFPNMYVVSSIFSNKQFWITTEKSMPRYKPIEFIRNCNKVKKLIHSVLN